MSINAHIQTLEQRHQSLESQLAELDAGPSVPDEKRKTVKLEKLRLKDEIERLRAIG
ncbi:YdcH family protein [Ahrensia sp. R2A130]|uniref:YdcH family protein n=1 Tax=Ahrensia sp. R2A130 TaxID=744979 RepID=UPI0001E0A4A6|nr:DUF465 domain-containing protein [Ahrensia sp. R2A130]EFL88645.1 coiled-coil domain-containing protein 149 [Ahrensia sp. R2A130]